MLERLKVLRGQITDVYLDSESENVDLALEDILDRLECLIANEEIRANTERS